MESEEDKKEREYQQLLKEIKAKLKEYSNEPSVYRKIIALPMATIIGLYWLFINIVYGFLDEEN